MYATKLTGAISDGLGTLNIWCKNIIYTNINNIYYKTSTASGFNDATTVISNVYNFENGGSVKHQSAIYDIEVGTVYIGNDTTSNTYIRGNCKIHNLLSDDGVVEMMDGVFSQFWEKYIIIYKNIYNIY